MKIIYIDKDTELLVNNNKNVIFFIPEKREERSFISSFTFFFTSIVISYALTMFILSLIFTKEELINHTKYKSI